MAQGVAGRLSQESAPASIEGDLSALWREIGRSGPVARAMMSNLLVVRSAVAPACDDASIEAVAARHPCRVLVIDYEAPPPGSPGSLSASVGIVTFGPPAARYGIERVSVRSNCAEASFPSLVRRFTRGGLPISVWWTEDFSSHPLIDPLVALGRQLVFDSGGWVNVPAGVRALARWLDRDIIDVNWRRLSPLRRAVVFAAGASPRAAWTPDRVDIGYRRDAEALAWLLAGWLTSRLGWQSLPAVEADGTATAPVTVTIRAGHDSTNVTLEGARAIITRPSSSPSSVGVPQEDRADAIAAELHALSRDLCLQDALRVLVRHFGG
jgi:glucose-6-phosphate dehydrogenase-like protein OpcA